MGPEIIAIIGLIRAITPELIQLVEDLGTLADGEELPVERLRELQNRGNELSDGLADLIARREAEGR